MIRSTLAIAVAACLLALPAQAQAPAAPPGAVDVSRVAAGTYAADKDHTQVVWSVEHMGFSTLYGMFGQIAGTLTLDPAKPDAAALAIDIPMSGLTVTSPEFAHHLSTPDLFDTAKVPAGRFVSTAVKANGTEAEITGDLTLHGVTRPVILHARFTGAGVNPMSKAATVGFAATAKVKRSDFGVGYGVPVVGDEVELKITAAFEKKG
jgi:polyisoprenoid-binding protein YceI